jgi:hypothetical protein
MQNTEGGEMTKLKWVSRHPLTDGQKALLPLLGYEGYEMVEMLFGDNPVEQISEVMGEFHSQEIGIVAPTYITLALLRAGYRLIEFVNEPSSRQKGVFVCKGVWRHSLAESKFTPCPLPPEEQEIGDLSPYKKEKRDAKRERASACKD